MKSKYLQILNQPNHGKNVNIYVIWCLNDKIQCRVYIVLMTMWCIFFHSYEKEVGMLMLTVNKNIKDHLFQKNNK